MPLEEISNRQMAVVRNQLKKPTLLPPAPPKRKAELSPNNKNDNNKIVLKKRVVLGDIKNCKSISGEKNMMGFVDGKKSETVTTMNIRKYPNLAVKKEVVMGGGLPVNPFLLPRKPTLKIITTKNDCMDALEKLSLTDVKKDKGISLRSVPPQGVPDVDKRLLGDEKQVSVYAMDIFNYLKQRESKFIVTDYLFKQVAMTRNNRALLVDWMVLVQDNFGFTHETLYLAVKLVDLYLCKVVVKKNKIQLMACTSLFIASKYEERYHLSLNDFITICDDLYSAAQITEMEVCMLARLGGQLGVPLSYSFLRRYARCADTDMHTLTLARYILEYSLMSYDAARQSDSKTAAAALYLAKLMMGREGDWTPTLEYYSGYKLEEFKDIVYILNNFLHFKPRPHIEMIRNKYSSKTFYCVATIPLLSNSEIR